MGLEISTTLFLLLHPSRGPRHGCHCPIQRPDPSKPDKKTRDKAISVMAKWISQQRTLACPPLPPPPPPPTLSLPFPNPLVAYSTSTPLVSSRTLIAGRGRPPEVVEVALLLLLDVG